MSHADPALLIYGLAFFAMGLAVWLKTTPLLHLPISRAFRWLAIFGMANGVYQWLLFYLPSGPLGDSISHLIIVLAALSYMALAVFATRIVDPTPVGFLRLSLQRLPYALFIGWLVLHAAWHAIHDTPLAMSGLAQIAVHQSPRYLLAVPSALLAAFSFARLSPFGDYGNRVCLYARLASLLFVNYAALSMFSGAADLYPAQVLNDENFRAVVGVPVHLLSAITAAGIGFCVVSALTLFDNEKRSELDRAIRDATTTLDSKVAELEAALADRKRTEERLEEQANLFRTVLDTVPAPVLVRDTELRFTYVNKQGEEHFGRPASELLGKTIAETLGAGKGEPLEDVLRQALALPPGKVLTLPNYPPISRPEKSMWLRAAPITLANGEKRGVVTVTVDISDLRNAERRLFESEALLQSILDHMPGTVGLRSPDGHYLVVGAGCKEWYQMTRDDLIGKTIDEIWSPEMARAVTARDQETIAKNVPTVFEAQTTFSNGETRTTKTIRFPVRNADGSLRGVGFVARDVTAEKQAEDQLRQAQKMEAVGQLTGGIAHDFNNLLGVIIGNLDFLEEMVRDSQDMHSLVESATNAALHGAALNRQLLAFSRKQALDPKEINLNAQIPGMLEMLRRSLPETIEIETIHADEIWCCVADASQVETALLNLALNARDAMPDGGRLKIETANCHIGYDSAFPASDLPPGDFAVLSVSDTGTGMTEEAIKHAFEPFFTTKEIGRGSGLGLSMVYGFAKQSGGHVTIDSEEGNGTTVRLYLPRCGDARSRPSLPSTAPTGQHPKKRVLVVESDSVRMLRVIDMLNDLEYLTVSATEGAKALEILRQEKDIDILLTDLQLSPDMDGIALARQAEDIRPKLTILYMSGNPDAAVSQDGIAPGDVVLLRKPFRNTDLATALRQAVTAAA